MEIDWNETPKCYTNSGTTDYKIRGKCHRFDGPAFTNSKVTKWYQYGVLHRVDGPAIEWANGTEEWWLNGVRHRLDGPAIEYNNGDYECWVNGKRHYLYGAACRHNDKKQYWINGFHHTPESFRIMSTKMIQVLKIQVQMTKKTNLDGN